MTPLGSNTPHGLPRKHESFIQLNSDFNAALAEVRRGFYELGPELEHSLSSSTYHIFPPFLSPSLWSISEMVGKHSGENMHHSFNPWFICNMLSICNVNFIVLNKEGTRKKLKKRSLPFRAHKKISTCETDHGIKCQLRAIRLKGWRSNSHLPFFSYTL